MADLDETACMSEIVFLFDEVANLLPSQVKPVLEQTRGKLYEALCVARLLAELQARKGWTAHFTGTDLTLKFGGGYANPIDPHFQLFDGSYLVARLYVDIFVGTLGAEIIEDEARRARRKPNADLSAYHEIDVAVVRRHHHPIPRTTELIIGLECKATADFVKAHVREALGRRRELSYLRKSRDVFGQPIHANPGSTYRLVFIDPHGLQYARSPGRLAVELDYAPV